MYKRLHLSVQKPRDQVQRGSRDGPTLSRLPAGDEKRRGQRRVRLSVARYETKALPAEPRLEVGASSLIQA